MPENDNKLQIDKIRLFLLGIVLIAILLIAIALVLNTISLHEFADMVQSTAEAADFRFIAGQETAVYLQKETQMIATRAAVAEDETELARNDVELQRRMNLVHLGINIALVAYLRKT